MSARPVVTGSIRHCHGRAQRGNPAQGGLHARRSSSNKPGITGSSHARSSPIIRGLDVNALYIVENGIGSNGASIYEDHRSIDLPGSRQVEVIRGPATLRYGSQSIGAWSAPATIPFRNSVSQRHPIDSDLWL
jgi:hypothetical protein